MYLDVYFIINLFIDWCTLSCAVRQYALPGYRIWLAAAVGAAGACIWEIAGASDLWRLVCGFLLSLVMLYFCIGKRTKVQWRKAFFELYAFSFLLAGILPVVSRYIPLWIFSTALSYAGIKGYLAWQERKRVKEIDVAIQTDDGSWQLRGLVDSGHLLKEPLQKKPVIIIKEGCLEGGPQANWPLLYQTVQGSGVMMGFWPKEVRVGEQRLKEKEVLVVVAREWKTDDYEALIPEYMMH